MAALITTFQRDLVSINIAVACLKIALSKCLGYGIVVGSAMSKLTKIIYGLFRDSGH